MSIVPGISDYVTVNDSLPGSQVWNIAGGAFVGLADAGFLSFLSSGLYGAPNAYAAAFQILDCSSASAGAATSLHVSNTAGLTSNAKLNVSGTTLYDGNQVITVLDSTHVTIPVAFAGNATGALAGAAIVATIATLLSSINAAASSAWNSASLSQSFSPGSALTLTNPLAKTLSITLSQNTTITLPQMNLANSLPLAQVLTVAFALNGFSATFKDFSASTLFTVLDGRTVLITNSSNSTSAGTISSQPTVIPSNPFRIGDFTDIPDGNFLAYNFFKGWIQGLGLSNDGSSPNTVLDIAAGGAAASAGGSAFLYSNSAFTKSTSTWAVGTGNGALDTGSVANNTWYHVFIIQRGDTGVVDFLFSTSATSPTMPTNYSYSRRIGSFKTDGSAHIIAFVQDGDIFRWDLPIADVNAVNPGTAAVTRTLTVPTGVQVYADMVVVGQNTGNSIAPAAIYISDLALTDRAAASPVGTFYVVSQITETVGILTNLIDLGGPVQCRTNTSGQVRSRLQISDAGTTLFINTLGWTDRRGAR